MSLEGLRVRARLARLPDEMRCVAVIITGSKRYEQDQYSLRIDIRTVFPEFDCPDWELDAWADRIKVL